MDIKGRFSFFLCVFLVLSLGAEARSETAEEAVTVWEIQVEHMLETLSGGHVPAEDTKEAPNPEYRPSAGFSDSVNALRRAYSGYTADKVETKTDSDGKIVKASVFYKRNTYQLRIEYMLDGQAIMTHSEEVKYEESYSVPTPEIEDCTADTAVITGTMGAEDRLFTVTYNRAEAEEPDAPEEPSTPTEPVVPSTPEEPSLPIEPSTPTEPSTPEEPDEPADASTPSEPSTTVEPDVPKEPSTPMEPDEPTEPSTPGEPGERPEGERPSGGRPSGGKGGKTENVISPGDALTSYHAMGDRNLTAYWMGQLHEEETLSVLNLDGGSAVIEFEGAQSSFFVMGAEDKTYILSSDESGTWKVGGFALKILRESGIDTLVIISNDTCIAIETEHAASGEAYSALKSAGVGERRMVYTYSIGENGEVHFEFIADGEKFPVEGMYSVFRKEADCG